MSDFNKNNLDKATSPYLKQHKDNPIHWQEWNEETLKHAKKEGKLIFVSVGYSTCHWCHVMAGEAFSDEETAKVLNESFVAIKVDREQRPDLDQFFMDFAMRTIGGGGWPLNVVLSPDSHPFFAGTYFPLEQKHNLPAFKDVLGQILDWFKGNKDKVQEYKIQVPETSEGSIEEFVDTYEKAFDNEWGGFGITNKFPPHNSLLFMMSLYEENGEEKLKEIIEKTLDAMALRGLHDHLQGGFYRYCVDREWTIPHFEKMLYDQAMHLWVYSVAYKLFGKELYKKVVEKLVLCLQESFEEDHMFYSGLDADTDHVEGATYVWTKDELKGLEDLYELEENFEGKVHLIKKKEGDHELELKLLEDRKKRKQPFVDKKIVTSWNALVGIGLVMADRYTDHPDAKEMADRLFAKLLKKHLVDGHLAHSSLAGKTQGEEFLEDYASVLLFATYLFEETFEGKELLEGFLKRLETFYDGQWMMNPSVKDFVNIPAQSFDHPMPSPVALAEFARFRARAVLEITEPALEEPHYMQPLQTDFYNMFVFLQSGALHDIHVKEKIDWAELPVNVLQMKGTMHLDCYNKMCKMFKTKEDLIEALSSKK